MTDRRATAAGAALVFTLLGAALAQGPGRNGAPQPAAASPGTPTTARVETAPLELIEPDRFRVPAVFQPARHVTVISGTWWAGRGATFDPNSTIPLGPGSYMLHPAGEIHYDGAKDVEAIVEIKGIGPAPTIPAAQ